MKNLLLFGITLLVLTACDTPTGTENELSETDTIFRIDTVVINDVEDDVDYLDTNKMIIPITGDSIYLITKHTSGVKKATFEKQVIRYYKDGLSTESYYDSLVITKANPYWAYYYKGGMFLKIDTLNNNNVKVGNIT